MKRIIILIFPILLNVYLCFKNLAHNKSLNFVSKRWNFNNRFSHKLGESKSIDLANDIKENDLIPNVKVMVKKKL